MRRESPRNNSWSKNERVIESLEVLDELLSREAKKKSLSYILGLLPTREYPDLGSILAELDEELTDSQRKIALKNLAHGLSVSPIVKNLASRALERLGEMAQYTSFDQIKILFMSSQEDCQRVAQSLAVLEKSSTKWRASHSIESMLFKLRRSRVSLEPAGSLLED